MIQSLLLVTGLLVAQSAPAPDEGLAAEVRRLVRQLDAPQLAQREAAEKALLKLGPQVLDLLPPIESRTPAEVAQRVGRLRQRLQTQLAESAARVSKVTLEQDQIPLSKALAAIEKQTGNKIVDTRADRGAAAADPEIRVELQSVPFWRALDEVLDEAEMDVYLYGEEKALRIVPRPEGHGPRAGRAAYAGPFRIEPIRIYADCDLRQQANRSLGVILELTWEPRLAPISLQARLADLSAVDNRGEPISIDTQGAELEVPIEPDALAKELKVPLALPSREAKKIASLKGRFTALLPGKTETFRFSKLPEAKDVQQRAAGVTVTLEQVRKNNRSWEIRVMVRFDEANEALQSHRGWIFDNEVYLEGPEGKRVKPGVFETIRQTKNEVGVAYLFRSELPLEQYSLVYKTAGLILPVPLEFELRDIELP